MSSPFGLSAEIPVPLLPFVVSFHLVEGLLGMTKSDLPPGATTPVRGEDTRVIVRRRLIRNGLAVTVACSSQRMKTRKCGATTGAIVRRFGYD